MLRTLMAVAGGILLQRAGRAGVGGRYGKLGLAALALTALASKRHPQAPVRRRR